MKHPHDVVELEWHIGVDDAKAVREALARDSREIRHSEPEKSARLEQLGNALGGLIEHRRSLRRVLDLFR